jgi:hypothetical protein
MPFIAANMANENITTVLQMVAWGTRLSFGLYDFSASVSSATGDVTNLAKEVNLLSLVLRQVGATLKEDKQMPSDEAFEVVRQILQQCQDVFGEIEQIVPVRELQNAQGAEGLDNNALAVRLRDGLDWNVLSRSKTQYLLAHLESLKLTLSVMLQTIYTAKITTWGRYIGSTRFGLISHANHINRSQINQLANDAVITERLQMESLVIEQQLSLLRSYKLYENFKQRVANTPLLLSQSQHSQALVRRDEYGPTPMALVRYQEPSLARVKPSVNEMEDLVRIRRISSPFVDILLSRWTKLSDIEDRMQRLNMETPSPLSSTGSMSQHPQRLERRNSNWRPPNVESDDSDSDDGVPRNRRPRLHVSTPGPVLMPVGGDEESDVISPIPVPGAGLRPSRGPFSPAALSSSWAPSSNTGNYFPTGGSPQSATSRPRQSPGPSPRTSFSSEAPTRPITAFKPTDSALQPSQQQPQRQGIPYRLRQRQNYWDFLDNMLIGANTQISHSSAMRERNGNAYTEIMSEFVSSKALRKGRYEYTRIQKDIGDRHRTRLETCYCIEGALSFNEILRLVDRTREIRYPPPRSSRSSRPAPPSLDRSYTAPVTIPRHASSHGGNSNTSDSDSGSSRKRREQRDKSRGRRDSDAKKGSGAATLTKLAMGAGGMLTLLDGLPEVLGYI